MSMLAANLDAYNEDYNTISMSFSYDVCDTAAGDRHATGIVFATWLLGVALLARVGFLV